MRRVRWYTVTSWSRFSDKDECFGCGEGVLCVVEAFHAEIMRQNREHWDITIPSPKIIPQSYVGRHMAPSSWSVENKHKTGWLLYEQVIELFSKGPLPRLFSSFFGYFIPLFYSNTSCYGVFRPKTEYWNPSPLVAFRQCDLYDESDKAVFVKYGESPEELNKTFTDLARLFEATGVEKYKIDYILNAVKQNER